MPHYPFTPELLDALPEELAELYRSLEDTLLDEICTRLNLADQLNEVTVQDIRALRSHGISLDEIKKAIQETTGLSDEKLDALLKEVVERNQQYYQELIDIAKVTAPEQLVDAAAIGAIMRQTKNDFKNLTASMGFLVDKGRTMLEPAKAYQWALDNAAMQVQSGAVSYNQAIRNAVKQLADSGIKTVSYESGHVDQIDVAARRAVMTGVNQLNQKYREQSLDYLETDLVEVTAHLGARNIDGPNGWENHAKWQGKVYRWNRGGRYAKPERRTAPDPTAPAQQEKTTPQSATPHRPAAADVIQAYLGANAPHRMTKAVDVTREYLDAATPGMGSVTYDEAFDKERHQAEVSFSEWLHKMFGGDIHLLNEANQDKVQTPDYIWRGKLWDLKTATTEKAADAAIRHGLKQINENPGGIFLDYRGRIIDLAKLQSIISSRMRHNNADSVDIMVILSDEIAKVFRYKK